MKYCSNCGNKIEDGASYCSNCGADLSTLHYNDPVSAPVPKKMNGLCVAGFICSFVFLVLGLVLSIIGLKDVKDKNEDGKEFAVAGIIISVGKLVFGLLILFIIWGIFNSMPVNSYFPY